MAIAPKKKTARPPQRKSAGIRDLKPKRDAKGGSLRSPNNVNLDAQKKEIDEV